MKKAIQRVAGYSTWVMLTAFLVPAVLIGLSLGLLVEVGVVSTSILTSSGGLLAIFALQFILGFLLMMSLPVLIQKKDKKQIAQLLGIHRSVTWQVIGYAVIALVGYLIVSAILQVIVAQLFPGYNVDEAQELGFSTDIGGWELLIAGTALVLLAPVFEELIFRGYLFGSLRVYVPFWVTALVVSILFGIAHGQLNVALDVFVLSMFMCVVREKTETIWGPILMHMMKNGLAFTLLFIVKIDTETLSFISHLK